MRDILKLSLLIFLLTFEAQAQPNTSNQIPFKITAPASGVLIFEDEIHFKGTAQPGSEVKIQNAILKVDEKGNWSHKVASPKRSGFYNIDVLNIAQQSSKINFSFRKVKGFEGINKKDFFEEPEGEIKPLSKKGKFQVSSFFMGEAKFEFVNFPGIDQLIHDAILSDPMHGYVTTKSLILPPGVAISECNYHRCAEFTARGNALDFYFTYDLVSGDAYKIKLQYYRSIESKPVLERVYDFKTSLDLVEKVNAFTVLALGKSKEIVDKSKSQIDEYGIEAYKWKRKDFDPYTDYLKGTRIKTPIFPDTLYEKKSPYIISKNILVPKNKTLYIQPGVQVMVGNKNVSIRVEGQIIAIGEPGKRIEFKSGREIPRGTDWDGISFNGSYGSVLTNVKISHAGFGLRFMNSGATLQNVLFETNEYNSVYASYSDVEIFDSKINSNAHVGILVDEYSSVKFVRSQIFNTSNALVVKSFGSLYMLQSLVENNEVGILLSMKESDAKISSEKSKEKVEGETIALSMNQVRLRKNVIGVISDVKVDLDEFDLHKNETEFKRFDSEKIKQIISNIPLAKLKPGEVSKAKKVNFGIKKIVDPIEVNTLGNVTTEIQNNIVSTSSNTTKQTIGDVAPGQEFPNDKVVDGLAYLASVYSLTEIGSHSIEFNMDMRYDDWVGESFESMEPLIKPVLLKYTHRRQKLFLGDFTQSGGDIYLSSRDIYGGKYQLLIGGDEYNKAPFSTTILYGETQRPLDEGNYNPESFSEITEAGAAKPQEVLMVGKLEYTPSKYANFEMGYAESKQQREGLFLRTDIDSASTLSEKKVNGKAFFWNGNWTNKQNSYELKTELSTGISDTLDALYSFPDTSDLTNQILVDHPEWFQNFDLWNWGLGLKVNYDRYWKNSSFSMYSTILSNEYYAPGAPTLTANSREYNFVYSMSPTSYFNFSLNYNLAVQNAAESIDKFNLLGMGEGTLFGLFEDKRYVDTAGYDIVRPKQIHTVSWSNNYTLNKAHSFDFDYKLKWDAQHQATVLIKSIAESDAIFADSYFAGTDTTVNNYGQDLTISQAKWARYRDNAGDTLASQFESKELVQTVGLRAKWQINKRAYLRYGVKLNWTADLSEFHSQDSVFASMGLNPTTEEKLGYYKGGNDYFQHEYPITFSKKWKLMNYKVDVKPKLKTITKFDETFFEWTLKNRFEMKLMKKKVKLSLDASLRQRTVEETQDQFYVTDSANISYFYLVDNEGVKTPVQSEAENTSEISITDEFGDGFTLRKRQNAVAVAELDWKVGLKVRYSFSSRLFTEAVFGVEDYANEDNLAAEYQNIFSSLQMQYSF